MRCGGSQHCSIPRPRARLSPSAGACRATKPIVSPASVMPPTAPSASPISKACRRLLTTKRSHDAGRLIEDATMRIYRRLAALLVGGLVLAGAATAQTSAPGARPAGPSDPAAQAQLGLRYER